MRAVTITYKPIDDFDFFVKFAKRNNIHKKHANQFWEEYCECMTKLTPYNDVPKCLSTVEQLLEKYQKL